MQQNKIYVGNLSYSSSEDDLNQEFSQYGNVRDVKIIMDRETGRSKGFGFITFEEDQAAQAALAHDGKDVGGRTVKVSIAKEPTRQRG